MNTKLLLFFLSLLSTLAFSQTRPSEPKIISVGTDSVSGLYTVKWDTDNTSNTDGFIVFRAIYDTPDVIDGASVPIIYIEGSQVRSFIDSTTQYPFRSDGIPEVYEVAAFRFDNKDTVFSTKSDPQSTTLISEIKFSECEKSNAIKWFKFRGWGNDEREYQILAREGDGASFTTIGTTKDSTFTHQPIKYNVSYSYRIKTINTTNLITSFSPIKKIFTTKKLPTTTISIENITVSAEQKIELTLNPASDKLISNYVLSRTNTEHSKIDTLLVMSNDKTKKTFIDNEATLMQSYIYHFTANDNCNNTILEGNNWSNIAARVSRNPLNRYILNITWTEQLVQNELIEEYKIFRLDHELKEHEIGLVMTSRNNSFEDDIGFFSKEEEELYNVSGNICYVVGSYKDNGNRISTSNRICIPASVKIYFPNAFNPYSSIEEDRTFKPIGSNPRSYSMVVYNRWGARVFETNEFSIGWDGTYNGQEAQEGVYTYTVQLIDEDDNKINKTSQVLLFYNRK